MAAHYAAGVRNPSKACRSVGALYPSLPIECRRAGNEVLDELREAFIKGDAEIDWMHPSYRDLVIDELARDAHLQQAFLSSTGLGGIKLAISDTGGASGD